jgi:hypothetical protein
VAEEAGALPADDDPDPDDEPDPDDALVAPGAGGAIRTGLSGFVVTGFETVRADVIEILTALGWMPNFSSVDDTASDNAP